MVGVSCSLLLGGWHLEMVLGSLGLCPCGGILKYIHMIKAANIAMYIPANPSIDSRQSISLLFAGCWTGSDPCITGEEGQRP